MKKKIAIFSLAIIVLFTGSVHAQQISAILRGGLNRANVSINDDGNIDDADKLISFQAGIIGDLELIPGLSLQPGLIFTGKGTKTRRGDENIGTWYRATSNPYYLEVPVNLVFKTPTDPVKFFAGAGPYIAMGIAGKRKVRGSFFGTDFSSENPIEWSNDDPTTFDYEEHVGFGIMKRFDYGLNGLLGIETKNLVISANYGLGLAKLQSGSNSTINNKNKHRVISFTFGFKL